MPAADDDGSIVGGAAQTAYALVAVPEVLAFIAVVSAKAGRPLGRVALLD